MWKHLSENGMATDPDELTGGIIDRIAMSMKLDRKEEWFIIFNHPDLAAIEGLSSKAEAFEVFAATLAAHGVTA